MGNSQFGSVGLLEEALFRSYVSLVNKRYVEAGKNMNVLEREIKGLHGNTAKGDLSEDFLKHIAGEVKITMAYLNAQGYVLVPRTID